MTVLSVFYFLVGALVSLYLSAFMLTSLAEARILQVVSRPVLPSLVLWAGFSLVWYLIYAVSKANIFLMGGAAVVVILPLLLFFFPFGKKKSVCILGGDNPSENYLDVRFDERDTIFARFDLERDTEHYNEYYDAHPELKEVDDGIRQLPALLSPGGKRYDILRAPLVEALFELEKRNAAFVDGEAAPSKKVQLDPSSAASLLKGIARQLGAADAGIAALTRRYVYSHVGRGSEPWGAQINTSHRYVIAFTVPMRFDAVSHAPDIRITEETAQQYVFAQTISLTLAAYIRRLGYPARAHVSGSNYQVILPAVAYEAGLGEPGRLGYLISPKLGARIRLGAITTDLPLETDEPVNFGVQDFCTRCRKCATACPSAAIPKGEKSLVRGIEKWQLNSERCFRYWRLVGTDCGLCMKVCPFSHPDTLAHNIIRLGIRRSAVARRVAYWGEVLFYGK